jgi:predicted GIY-YIG superfamily endonuclease
LREFERVDEAVSLERQIESWSRAKKQALIRRDDALPALAARRKKLHQHRSNNGVPSSASN